MKKITIAFDCDGTLIKNEKQYLIQKIENEDIVDLLIILSKFKNVKIVVWSGQGEAWARECARELNIEQYVHSYASKNHLGKDDKGKHKFDPDIKPDICIDDLHDCDLGLLNLIVKQK